MPHHSRHPAQLLGWTVAGTGAEKGAAAQQQQQQQQASPTPSPRRIPPTVATAPQRALQSVSLPQARGGNATEQACSGSGGSGDIASSGSRGVVGLLPPDCPTPPLALAHTAPVRQAWLQVFAASAYAGARAPRGRPAGPRTRACAAGSVASQLSSAHTFDELDATVLRHRAHLPQWQHQHKRQQQQQRQQRKQQQQQQGQQQPGWQQEQQQQHPQQQKQRATSRCTVAWC
ncbi:hypothetical protein FOA52_010366 [Chlamydomonas sp. UWO 241]|nr:hypothetical protein FOA52_010366 [Chlamydomonas sp. UWO 241]